MQLDRFRELPILGILRGIEADAVEPLAQTAIAAGLRALEITMNTPGAPSLIRRMVAAARGRMAIGAGTVLTADDLAAALDAGASFVVMPTLVVDVVRRCAEKSVPVFPGALTPQEIHAAWSAGATMVKVFPANCFGPTYFSEVRGPFREIELLACGGVTAENLPEYFAAGASAVAFGSSIFRAQWMSSQGYGRIGDEIEKLIGALRAWRAQFA